MSALQLHAPAPRLAQDAPRYVLIQDPLHVYAVRFMQCLSERYGLRAICLYTNPKRRYYESGAFPALSSEWVAESYDVPAGDLASFAAALGQRYDIAAVIPFSEETLMSAALIADHLASAWCPKDVITRFRDKFEFKEHLRRVAPALRINRSRRVSNLDEVVQYARELDGRFVIKPNDGFANRDVGFFTRESPVETLRSYLAATDGRPLVMEEFIEGSEYFVNGQVDATGAVTVYAVFEYMRIAANGRANLDHGARSLPHASQLFATLESYVRQVVRASGLVRSPFHAEVKVDARGPCLVEIAARLCGNGNILVCNDLHGPPFDALALAAHYYVTDEPYGPLGLNWERYDATEVSYVCGIATQSERVYGLNGVREIEAMPEFNRWVSLPIVGKRVTVTRDLLSTPWSLVLAAPRGSRDLAAAATRIRAIFGWNRGVSVVTRARVLASYVGRKVRMRLGWWLCKLRQRLRG